MEHLMDGIREALDGAEEAAAEHGGESEDVLEGQEEEASQDDQEAPEPIDEDQTEDESESEESGETEDDGGVDEWVSRVDELPVEKLPPRIAKLRSDRDRMASELGALRREMEKLKSAQPQPEPQQKADAEEPMPERPTENDDFETVMKKWEAISEWKINRALKGLDSEYRSKFQTIEEREKESAVRQQTEFLTSQAARIEARQDYSDDVGAMMSAIVAKSPGWQAELASPEGWDRLCDYAVVLTRDQAKKQEVATKKATARQRAVPRGTASPKKVESDIEIPENPQDVYGRIGAIMDSYPGGQ